MKLGETNGEETAAQIFENIEEEQSNESYNLFEDELKEEYVHKLLDGCEGANYSEDVKKILTYTSEKLQKLYNQL